MNALFFVLASLVLFSGCNQNDMPTGVSQTDIEGVWFGKFQNTTLFGRSLSGDADWQFDRKNFQIEFYNPPVGQAELLSGDWKFAKGRVVLTLRSSFPIRDDVGSTDSLFVSLLNNRMSIQTTRGSNLILQKIRSLVLLWKHPVWIMVKSAFFSPQVIRPDV